jgi:integrase
MASFCTLPPEMNILRPASPHAHAFRPSHRPRPQAWEEEVLKRVEWQTNVHLPAKECFTVSPHVLRHTFLRKLAETKGVQYAKEASGHKTDRYICAM